MQAMEKLIYLIPLLLLAWALIWAFCRGAKHDDDRWEA